jgi:hypothetical protein
MRRPSVETGTKTRFGPYQRAVSGRLLCAENAGSAGFSLYGFFPNSNQAGCLLCLTCGGRLPIDASTGRRRRSRAAAENHSKGGFDDYALTTYAANREHCGLHRPQARPGDPGGW